MMLRMAAILSLLIGISLAMFLSGAWLPDSRRGAAVWLIIAVFCAVVVLALI